MNQITSIVPVLSNKTVLNLGYEVRISNNIEVIKSSDIIILPGVGAFPEAIKKLRNLNLFNTIKECVNLKIKVIGICLGMQLLFNKSYEFKKTSGLCILPGNVKKIKSNNNLILPHVGWNKVLYNKESKLRKFEKYSKKNFYFVHSYYAETFKSTKVLMYCFYNECKIPALVKKNNIFAFQFHPEKSGVYGLNILRDAIEY